MNYRVSVLAIFITFISFIKLCEAQQAAVYRWVDEQGNVHFADQPKSKNAKLVFVSRNNIAQPSVRAEQVESTLAQNTKQPESEQQSKEQELMAVSCDDIKAEAAKAREIIANAPAKAATPAILYLAAAEKILAEKKCQ